MKILHIITGLGTGGAERMLVKLIKSEVDGKRHEVITLTDLGTQGDILIAMGINVHVLRIKNILVPLHILKYMIFIKKHRFDVIQGWMYHGNVVAFLFSLINKKKVLLFNIRHSLHSIKNEKTSTKIVININKLITKYATYIIYNSDISRLQHESFGYKCNNALVVYNGFDTDVFKKNTTQKKYYKKKYNIGENKIVIGKIGRNHPMKNHYGFIKAIDKVIARNKNVMFVIIGRGVREDKNIEAHINNNNIGSYVKLIDEQNNIHEQINLFDCLVMNSSWGEAFPNVIGEAMLSEIPCIVTDIGDSKRIIGDKGILVKPNCENDLAKAINEIIDMNKDDYEYLGKTAREKIIKNYSISSVYEKYNKIYVNG